MDKGLPPPTTEYVPDLVANGACLCLPENKLFVPIPLIDVRINSERLIVWATIQTPFGSEHPVFGLIRYARQDRLNDGSAFYDADDRPLAAIIDVRGFAFPKYTTAKLVKKAREHAEQMRTDLAYRTIWDAHFAHGIIKCMEAGQ